MENLTYDSWMLIGLALTLFLASIAMSIHVMKKYPPEHIPSSDDSSQDETVYDDVNEDD